jgi:hypothetical protein
VVSFLFWNLGRRPVLDRIVRMVVTFNVDVLVLAECAIESGNILASLNRSSETPLTMTIAIPDLWSDDIKVDIVTPLAIFRAQTGSLHQRTKGLLEAEVRTTTGQSGRVRHQLVLIAPVDHPIPDCSE